MTKKQKTWLVVGIVAVAMVPVVGVLAILAAILVPAIAQAKELANRQACSANLSGIAKSMCIYANENMDAFPTVITDSLRDVGEAPCGGDSGTADAEAAVKSLYTPGQRKATQSLWLLVVLGQAQPQQFVCRSDTAAASGTKLANGNWQNDFAGSGNLSYSMASPWVDTGLAGRDPGLYRAPWWKNNADAHQPIMADGIKAGADFSKAMDVAPAHRGQGSNVSFGDAHVEWVPITQSRAGYSIYVSAGAGLPDMSGLFATGNRFPAGTYVVPTTISGAKTSVTSPAYDMMFVPPLVGR